MIKVDHQTPHTIFMGELEAFEHLFIFVYSLEPITFPPKNSMEKNIYFYGKGVDPPPLWKIP